MVSYSVIVNPQKKRFLIAKRIGGDRRLLDFYCLGFGGHLNQEDIGSNPNIFLNGLLRELDEEINFAKKEIDVKLLGYVRDLESPTNEHLGATYIVFAKRASIREEDNLNGFWVSYDDLKNKYYEKLESWSRYILDYLYEDPYWNRELCFDHNGNIGVQE